MLLVVGVRCRILRGILLLTMVMMVLMLVVEMLRRVLLVSAARTRWTASITWHVGGSRHAVIVVENRTLSDDGTVGRW